MKIDGTIKKYKAKLVAQGFGQKAGIDFLMPIRVILALTSIYKHIVHQIDLKTAFLHGDLEEEIYI